MKIKNCPKLSIKGLTKFYLTIYTPDGPDETEYCAIDFYTGDILYASGNFSNFDPDFENNFSYIIEAYGKDIKENQKFIYNQDMFEGESYHENLSDKEIAEIEKTFIDNGKYKEVISIAQAIIPDGGIN
jgi:hypothetical protein